MKWGRKWIVGFNVGKTQLVLFDRSNKKSKLISEKRVKERLRQQKHREKLREQCTPNIKKQGYSSVRALSRETNKVRKYLPYSPSKQRAVVKTLGNSLSLAILLSISKLSQIFFQWKQNSWSLNFTNETTLIE